MLTLCYAIVICAVLFQSNVLLKAHPQCSDSEPPFPSQRLSFCNFNYKSETCCTRDRDKQLFEKAIDVFLNNWPIKGSCWKYIKRILCTHCSPFEAHIYDSEPSSNSRITPSVCNKYCHEIFNAGCAEAIAGIYAISDVSTTQNMTAFCNAFVGQDVDYCYPRVINIPASPYISGSNSDKCLCVKEVANELTNPLALTHSNDQTHRRFILQQNGIVKILMPNNILLREPFLSIRDRIKFSGEQGLLGIAFHPLYSVNGRVFIYYSERGTREELRSHNVGFYPHHQTVLSEIRVSSDNPNQLNITSEVRILVIPQPYSNHEGGQILFDDDNYLYLTVGDGGSRGDQLGLAQRKSNLYGSMLRLDVDSPNDLYSIPVGNPFYNSNGDERKEIYAYGLRNAWRCSIDRGNEQTGVNRGRILCGDVGEGNIEEVDIIKRGGNYGWSLYEGTKVYARDVLPLADSDTTVIPPIIEYSHSVGKSVTGGYVYRGCTYSEMQGRYIFGDYGSGKLYSSKEDLSAGKWSLDEICIGDSTKCTGGNITTNYKSRILSFGESESGELYLLSTTDATSNQERKGSVYQIVGHTLRQVCSLSKTPREPVNMDKPPLLYKTHCSKNNVCGPSALPSPEDLINSLGENSYIINITFTRRRVDMHSGDMKWGAKLGISYRLPSSVRSVVQKSRIVSLWEDKISRLCRCVSKKVIDPIQEQIRQDVSFIVSGDVSGNKLMLNSKTSVFELSDHQYTKELEKLVNSSALNGFRY